MSPEVHKELSLFERIGNDAKSRLAMVSIGLVGAIGTGALAQREEAAAANPAPGATASDLEEDCIRAGLVKPLVEGAQILGPREFPDGSKARLISAKLAYAEMPEECRTEYGRTSRAFVEIQNPEKRQKWAKATIAPYYKEDEAGTTGILEGVANSEGVYYNCTPGPKKTGARLVVANKVFEKGTNKLAGAKVYKQPIKVVKAC
jgi:hypothetical protein